MISKGEITMLTQVKTVETIEEAKITAKAFLEEGYVQESLYVLAHEEQHTDVVASVTEASKIGIIEEGVFTAIANLFRSRGDELRAKMKSVGISQRDAEELEEKMDEGNIVIIATGIKLNLDDKGEDPSIVYHPYMMAASPKRFRDTY
jgi:hypothetical protein